MQIFNLILKLILLILVSGFGFYLFSGYGSAFEADKLCHFNLKDYSSEKDIYGCDHDIETHQWLLYQDNSELEPPKIIKRYRYKYL